MGWVSAARVVGCAAVAGAALAACALEVGGLEAPSRDAGAASRDGGHGLDAAPADAASASDAAIATSDAQVLDAFVAVDATSSHDAAPGPVTVTVPPTSGIGCPPFFESGVYVAAGDTVSITASGTWAYRAALFCGPDGSTTPLGTLNGAPYGMLLAQIGGNAAFQVGSSFTATVEQSGEIAFGINDDQCLVNYGSLTVSVTVTP